MYAEKCSGEKSLLIQCVCVVHSTVQYNECAFVCVRIRYVLGWILAARTHIYKRMSKQIYCEPRPSMGGGALRAGWANGRYTASARLLNIIHPYIQFLLLYAYTLQCIIAIHHRTMVVQHTAAKSYSTPRLIDK